MAVAGAPSTTREEILTQVERIARSGILQNSESLCKLLRYLTANYLDSPGRAVKEYQIATEVFGRARDFDPRLDSTVRVQTGRLRSKLAEYYGGTGAEDPVIVDLPKGAYALQVKPRPEREPERESLGGPESIHPAVVAPGIDRGLRTAVWVLGSLCAVLAAGMFYSFATRPAMDPSPPEALRQFWGDFLSDRERPWVVFSNAEFTGRPETGMRYFDPRQDGRDAILDHYTGVGEVIAIHELDSVFGLFRRGVRVKRGRLLSLDDVKNNDVIFVGSPTENLALRDVPVSRDFSFRVMADGPRKGDLAIINNRPAAGEQEIFVGSRGLPLTEDYAVVALGAGMNQSLRTLLLAGTTTIGTQAAAEFVTRANDAGELLRRTGALRNAHMPFFEAVLRVKVNKGVPVQSEIVALHTR
jgi:hypothetical protein